MSFNKEDYHSCESHKPEFINTKPYKYRNTNCIEKPFENTRQRNTLADRPSHFQNLNNNKSLCKARKVHDSIYNSNSKIISNKVHPTKCNYKKAKEVFRNLRNSIKNPSFSDVLYTSPQLKKI